MVAVVVNRCWFVKVAENAKRKAIAAAHSLIQRWSEAEDDDGAAPARDFPPSRGAKPSKPPRPAVSPQRYDDEDLLPSPAAAEERADGRGTSANPVPKPRTTISQPKAADRGPKLADGDDKYETVMREMESASKIELATVEALDRRDDPKWVDAKLMEQPEHLADEVALPADDRDLASAPWEQRGLRMRVTGDMPKAYSRRDKDSARTAFMLAPPVGIESSSEASDSEPLPARAPTASRDRRAAAAAAEVDDGMEPLPPTSSDSAGKPTKLLPLYAKPYKSFGKIETRVDALEEALKEQESAKKAKEQLVPVPNIKGSWGCEFGSRISLLVFYSIFVFIFTHAHARTHTHTRLMAFCPGLPR